MNKYCKGCSEIIPPQRIKILPNTKVCVNCSTTGTKRGITILKGDVNKDDTWVETLFLDEEEYNVYEKSMGRSRNVQRPEIEDAESETTG